VISGRGGGVDAAAPSIPRKPPRRGCALAVAICAAACIVVTVYRIATWPDVAALARHNPTSTAFIDRYRDQQSRKGRSPNVAWTWVAYGRISPNLKRAVLVGEDIGFFSHHGFDTAEIHNALSEAWHDHELPRGASTLTQQLAKNLWLSPSVDPVRKLREALLTRQLEKQIGKRRILELYLNVVEFGPGVYGAEAAARRYFDKSASDLSPEEAAQLAAGLPRPSTWHPGSTSRAYNRRVQRLLRRMAQADFLWREI